MKIHKYISGLLVFFFFTNSAFAQVPLSTPKLITSAVDLKSPAADIHIPAEFGSVQRNSPGAGPVVIHIADAHAHYEAQIQIKNILDHLIRTYSVRLIGVEGASSALRPEIFRIFSDKKVNSSVADSLVKRGELSGAEFLAIQDDSKNAPVWTGVEDKELYLKDLAAFRSVWNRYEAKKDFFEKQKIEIAKLKMRTFSEELRKFDDAQNQFEDRKLNFIDYGRILQKSASQQLKLDLTNPIHQKDFPNLVRIAILSKIETDVQKQSAQIEKEKTILKSKLKGFEWKTEGLNRRYFENLYGASRKNKVSLDQFPAFKQWAEYEILKSEIEAPALFSEIEGLEKRIYDSLIRNSEERNLVNRSQNLRSTEKFTRLEVTREEYEKFQFFGEKEIEPLVQEASKFYNLALKRESMLLSNLLKKAREQKLSKVVLVTGGFHTSGIENLLKSQKISHVTVNPKITNEDKSGNYLRVILDKIPAPLPTGNIASPERVQQLVSAANSLGRFFGADRNDLVDPYDSDSYLAELIANKGVVPAPKADVRENRIYQVISTDGEEDMDVVLSDPRYQSFKVPVDRVLIANYLRLKGLKISEKKKGYVIYSKANASSLGMVDFSGAQLTPEMIANFAASPVGLEAARLELEGERSAYPTPDGNLVPRFGYKDSVDGVLSERAAKNRDAIKQWTAEQKAKGRKVMLHFGIGGQGMSNSVQIDYWGEDRNNRVIVIDRLGTSMKEVFDDLISGGYKPSEIILDTSSKSGTTDETLIFYQAAFIELIKRLGQEKGIEDEAKALSENFVSFFKKFNAGKEKAELFANIPESEFNAAFNPAQRELLKAVFDQLVFTTSKNPRDSRLYALVEGMKNIAPIAVFDFSEFTGGRFTENSESALVTNAWRGIDIDSMIESLTAPAKNYWGENGNNPEVNTALRAAIATQLIDPSIIVVAVRSPNALSEALQKVQLFPESNGKNNQGAFIVPAVGEAELNEKVQKIFDQTGKAPMVIMVDLPEGKYEGLKPLSLNAELSAKTPHLRYIKENISPESNARFALWFQEYTIRYGLITAAKLAVSVGAQLEIPKVGAAGMNQSVLDGKPNVFSLVDPQNQPYVELAKAKLVEVLSDWASSGQLAQNGLITRYYGLNEQVKMGPVVEKSSLGVSGRGAKSSEESGLFKLHSIGVKFAGQMTSRLEAKISDAEFLASIAYIRSLKKRITSLSGELFEAVKQKDDIRAGNAQKYIEQTLSIIRDEYLKIKDFGKEKSESKEMEAAAEDLATLMLIARQGAQPKIFSPIFYTHLPEADFFREFFGFIDSGIGTRDQHANFQHRLDGKDIAFNLLVDVVTPLKTVMANQDPVATYGLAKDYLDTAYPDEVRRLFLEQEYKALTGEIGIDTVDVTGTIIRDKRINRSAAILRIADISTDDGLLKVFRVFARAQILYEETLKAQQGTSGKSLGDVISKPSGLSQKKNILKFEDIQSGKVAFDRYDKLIPLAVNFLRMYGGSKEEYGYLRPLADSLEGATISIGETKDPYADIDRAQKSIILNREFVDFLFMTGRKKIAMAWLADIASFLSQGQELPANLKVLIMGGKSSLSDGGKTRLDDSKAIFDLRKKIALNDTPKSSDVPAALVENDVLLIISDYMHRGRILDAPRLQRMLRREFGYYGNFSVEKLSELLEKFYSSQKDKITRREVIAKDDIEGLKKKLAETANISLADIASKVTKTLRYSFKREYMSDPAFKNRLTVWDVEVERQDEVDFGGKTAHTGELMFAPRAVTLENFATGSQGFQALINYNTTKIFTDNLKKNIDALRKLMERESTRGGAVDFLELTNEELIHQAAAGDKAAEILITELTMLRVVLDAEGKLTVGKQLEAVIEGYSIVLYDLEHYKYKVNGVREYFNQLGKSLDELVVNIKTKKATVEKQIELAKSRLDDLRKEEKIILESKPEEGLGRHGKDKKLAGKRKEIDGKITEIKALESLEMHYQKEFEEVTIKNANRFLYAARNLVVPPDLDKEIKDNLKLLAARLGLPIEKLVLAIRSSAVGEDSEEASFAGRQDTYIFQTATPKNIASEINKNGLLQVDPDGLDNFVTSWVFNQASLFNKRAIDYRFDKGLPTFDNHVEISTLFQRMFLSKYSFIAFSVDRGTAFPSMSMNIHEGQGEMLVSGQESGSKYVVSLDGQVVIVRDKGERNLKVVETDDRMGKRKIPLSGTERREFSVTDENLVKASADYFRSIDDFYDEGFVDLEGAYRPKEDESLKSIPLRDESGAVLKDHRGFDRMDWNIVSTQARPETVYSLQDPSVIKLKKIVVTDAAFEKAERERKVMDFKFIARTEGTAQGEVSWVHDKTNPDELAKVKGKIMATRQSDPDMNSAMLSAKGIVAILGGQNSHTMIVASEYGLVAITGTSEQLEEYFKEGMEVTIDAERGKILLGYDHELKVAGRDFSAREIPDTPYGTARSSTIVASRDKAMFQHPLRNIPSYKGVGLKRLEIDLAFIETYTDALLAYDNMILQEKGGKAGEGQVLDRKEDQELIEFIEEKIAGFNSGRDFYETVIREGILATAEPLNPDDDEVRLRYQQIKNKELRLTVKDIVDQIYKEGLGHNSDRLLIALRILYDAQAADSLEHKLLEEILGLLDKRLYIRLDDRKSDEYKNVKGAEKFVKEELNAMKGFRGLSLLLSSPTLKWQLKVMIDVAKLHRHKIAIFAPIVRRPEDFKKLIEKFLEVGKELGLSEVELANLVEIGMMTEIPTNSVYMEDYLTVVQGFRDQGIPIRFFTSTGGNDGLQTIYRIDRNTGDAELKNNATAYGPAVIRWNSRIPSQQKQFNKEKIAAMKEAVKANDREAAYRIFTEIVEAGYCGNDPSVRGQEEYGRGLSALGYKSVSVVIEAYEKVAKNLAVSDVKDLGPLAAGRYEHFEKEKDFDFVIDPSALPQAQDYIQVNLGDILLDLGAHYRLLADYDALKLTGEKGELLAEEVKKLLRSRGYSANEEGVGMKYFKEFVQEKLEEKFIEAKKSGKKLVIGTDDALTSVQIEDGEKFGGMRGLLGGDRYEALEANPDYGFAGLVKNVTRDREFFKRQLEIVRELKSAYPDVSLGITLRLVRTFTDINEALAVMKETGLIKSISLFETPSKHGFRLALRALEEAGLIKLPINGQKDAVESALAVLEKRNMIRGENRDITDEKSMELLNRLAIALKISPKKTDLKAIMEKLKELGFVGGAHQKRDVSIGLDVQVTANLFELKEILDPVRRIHFLSIPDAQEFAGEMMALERRNVNNDLITDDDIRYQTRKPIQILATAAANHSIPFTLPASDLAETEFAQASSLGTRAEMKLVNRPEFTIGYVYFNPNNLSSSNPHTLKLLDRIFYSGQSFNLDQFGSMLETGENVAGVYKFIYRDERKNDYGFLLKDGSVLSVLYGPTVTKSGIVMLKRGEKRYTGPGTGKKKSVADRAYEIHQAGPDFIQEESHFKPSILGKPYFWLKSDRKDLQKDIRKLEDITKKTTFKPISLMARDFGASYFDALLMSGEEPVAVYLFQKAANSGVVAENFYGVLLKDGSILPFDVIVRLRQDVLLQRGVKRFEGPGTGADKTVEERLAEIQKTGTASSLGSSNRPTTVLSSGENEKELRKITNDNVRNWVREMTAFTGADSIEVVDASDDDRLLDEEVAAGKLIKLPDGNYYGNSHPKDVARSEERTFVSTKDPNDKGLNNNWKHSDELKPKVKDLVRGSVTGKKMYVIPYLMGPVGSEFAQVGVEVTDSRYVALNMIRMTKVGKAALDHLGTSDKFLKGVHSTGNLEQIHKDIAEKNIDNRYFASFPDDREIWSYGSAYGGNALLGKKFHSLRQAGYDARKEGWLAEHMAILEVENLKTGEKKYVAAAFPSASGKTNFAMMKPPASLEKDFAVRVVGDDIAWLRVGKDGRLRAVNPENGYFGVVPGTNYETNPAAMDSIRGGTKTLFTNVAINEKTGELWWEGKSKNPPADIDGWKDWQGKYIKDRKPEDLSKPWAHPNSRFTTSAVNAPNVSSAFTDPEGVPISAIFWGGRLKDREPLIRQLHNSADGVYDGLVMGVEATAAADGKAGQFRPDPNAMKPFFSYNEADYAKHWIEVMARLGQNAPAFFHVNWFRKGTDGRWLWPGYGDNLRLVLWALDRADGRGGAVDTAIGFMPRKEDLNLEGLSIPDADISELLSVDAPAWKKEAVRRDEFLGSIGKDHLPVEVLSEHNRFTQHISNAASLGETTETPKELPAAQQKQEPAAVAEPAVVQPAAIAPQTEPYDPSRKSLEDYKPGEFRPRTDNILGLPKKDSAVTREGVLDRKPSPSGTRNLFVGRGKNVDGKRTDNILRLPTKTKPNRNIRGKSLGSDWNAVGPMLDQNLNFDSLKVPQGLRQSILVRFNKHYSVESPNWLKIAVELRNYLKGIKFDREGGEDWKIKQLPQETVLGVATSLEVRHVKHLVSFRLPYEIRKLGGETSEEELLPFKGASLGTSTKRSVQVNRIADRLASIPLYYIWYDEPWHLGLLEQIKKSAEDRALNIGAEESFSRHQTRLQFANQLEPGELPVAVYKKSVSGSDLILILLRGGSFVPFHRLAVRDEKSDRDVIRYVRGIKQAKGPGTVGKSVEERAGEFVPVTTGRRGTGKADFTKRMNQSREHAISASGASLGDVLEADGRSLGDVVGTIKDLAGRVIGNEIPAFRDYLYDLVFGTELVAIASEDESLKNFRGEHASYALALPDAIYAKAHQQQPELAVLATTSDLYTPEIDRQLKLNPKALAVIIFTGPLRDLNSFKQKFAGVLDRVIIEPASKEEAGSVMNKILTGSALCKLAGNVKQTELARHTAVFASSDVLIDVKGLRLSTRLVASDADGMIDKHLASLGISKSDFYLYGSTVGFLIAKKGGYDALTDDIREGLSRPDGNNWVQFNLGLLGAKIAQLAQEFAGFQAVLRAA